MRWTHGDDHGEAPDGEARDDAPDDEVRNVLRVHLQRAYEAREQASRIRHPFAASAVREVASGPGAKETYIERC